MGRESVFVSPSPQPMHKSQARGRHARQGHDTGEGVVPQLGNSYGFGQAFLAISKTTRDAERKFKEMKATPDRKSVMPIIIDGCSVFVRYESSALQCRLIIVGALLGSLR